MFYDRVCGFVCLIIMLQAEAGPGINNKVGSQKGERERDYRMQLV